MLVGAAEKGAARRLLWLLVPVLLTTAAFADLDAASRLINVSAVEGQTAELPCDVTAPMSGDELRLVLWYHGTGGTPIYTYDARGRKSLRGAHWKDSSLDRSRVQFQPDSKPAHLRISAVEREDERLYRCRVDFLHSPTRNSRVNLTVVVPPELPVLYDSLGHMVIEMAGPFREGQNASVTCVTNGGLPSPNVTWWSGNALLDDTWNYSPGGAVSNQLTLGPLTRDDLGAEFTCWATNHVLSPPRSSSFRIEMLLPPLSVSLLGSNTPRSVGVTYEVTCQTVGSRPPASISWWIGARRVQVLRERQVTSDDGNMTRSVLSWTPGLQDVGLQLSCTAHNHKLRLAPLEDTWPLTIHYKPQPILRLWSAPKERGIRQGDDVYLKCDVRAEPPITSVEWRFQSRPVSQYLFLTAEVNADELVLREVTARAAGNYSCVATNAEGATESNTVFLNVQVPPACRDDRPVVLHASRGKTLNVTCRVSANPLPRRFVWALNASGSEMEVPEASVTSRGLVSTITLTPRTTLDFGTLSCVASNSLGSQAQPCLFHLLLAEKPGAVHNCTVRKLTETGLEVVCVAGFDGGRRQWFSVVVEDAVTQHVALNSSSALPRFYISDLKPDHNYTVSIYSQNELGDSPVYRLRIRTPSAAAAAGQMGSLGSVFRMTPILGILIGIVGTLVLLAISIVVTMRMRGHNDAKEGYPASCEVTKAAPATAADLDDLTDADRIRLQLETIDDPEERYMVERLISGPQRKVQAVTPTHSAYSSLGRGEYTRVPSPKMPVYQGPYFTLPRDPGQRSCSSDASEGRCDAGQSDSSRLEEAAPLMAADNRRESVV